MALEPPPPPSTLLRVHKAEKALVAEALQCGLPGWTVFSSAALGTPPRSANDVARDHGKRETERMEAQLRELEAASAEEASLAAQEILRASLNDEKIADLRALKQEEKGLMGQGVASKFATSLQLEKAKQEAAELDHLATQARPETKHRFNGLNNSHFLKHAVFISDK